MDAQLTNRTVWLQVGPEGCGKSTVLDYCFSRLAGRVTVATVHCSAQTTADNIVQKLLQVGGMSLCVVLMVSEGKQLWSSLLPQGACWRGGSQLAPRRDSGTWKV